MMFWGTNGFAPYSWVLLVLGVLALAGGCVLTLLFSFWNKAQWRTQGKGKNRRLGVVGWFWRWNLPAFVLLGLVLVGLAATHWVVTLLLGVSAAVVGGGYFWLLDREISAKPEETAEQPQNDPARWLTHFPAPQPEQPSALPYGPQPGFTLPPDAPQWNDPNAPDEAFRSR